MMNKIIANEDFFNQLADEYDMMIPFAEAVERKKKILKDIISREMKNAADIGCGTGTDSIVLARLGLNVASFDLSPEMIGKAKANAVNEKVKINFSVSDAANIPNKFNDSFDLVISFGNTFANIKKEEFVNSLHRCFNILKKNGMLLIQVLNFEKIIREKQRIININSGGNKFFIRFFDLTENEIVFNLLSFNAEIPAAYKLVSTALYPYGRNEFESGLKNAGFGKFDFHEDLNFLPFREKHSENLIIKAFKD